MIIDRTSADVELAKKIIREKIQPIFPLSPDLTPDDKRILQRGTCSVDMLNRIENKQKEIANMLNIYAYPMSIQNKTDWKDEDFYIMHPEATDQGEIFNYQDHSRLLSNLDKLKQAFFIYPTTPKTPDYLYNYVNANAVEKILVDIENMISDMERHFRECDTFYCGEEEDV